eukprot:888342-Prymnesium_polylepis.1
MPELRTFSAPRLCPPRTRPTRPRTHPIADRGSTHPRPCVGYVPGTVRPLFSKGPAHTQLRLRQSLSLLFTQSARLRLVGRALDGLPLFLLSHDGLTEPGWHLSLLHTCGARGLPWHAPVCGHPAPWRRSGVCLAPRLCGEAASRRLGHSELAQRTLVGSEQLVDADPASQQRWQQRLWRIEMSERLREVA